MSILILVFLMIEKFDLITPDVRHYEFPIVFNGMLAEASESPTSAAIVQSSLDKMNASVDDFTVKIGTMKFDLAPWSAKIKATTELDAICESYVQSVGQYMGDFLGSFTRNNFIADSVRDVLEKCGLDFSKVKVESCKIVGPNIGAGFDAIASPSYVSGGAHASANALGAQLTLGYEGADTAYTLTLSANAGVNAGAYSRKRKVGPVQVKNDHELRVGFLKIGFSSKTKTPATTKLLTTTPQPILKPDSLKTHQNSPAKQSKTTVNQKAQNDLPSRLQVINKSQSSPQDKAGEIMAFVRAANQTILEQRRLQQAQQDQQKIMESFQGVMAGFNLIAQLGETAGNNGLIKMAGVGLALTQATMSIGKLSGTMGFIAPTTTMGMIGPSAALAGAGLALASALGLFGGNKRGKKEAKAMQKMMNQLSEQIAQIHSELSIINQNMLNGFEAVMTGLGTVNRNLIEGFSSLHDAMYQYFSRMGEMVTRQYEGLARRMDQHVNLILGNQAQLFDFMAREFYSLNLKLDGQSLQLSRVDAKQDMILKQLQQQGLRAEATHQREMVELAESYTYRPDQEKLFTLLQKIRYELINAAGVMSSLPIQGNALTGWYHLNQLLPLFQQRAFYPFAHTADILNLDWAAPAFDCVLEIFPALFSTQTDNLAFNSLRAEVVHLLRQRVQSTLRFMNGIGSETFLRTFFNYHRGRLEELRDGAEAILNPLRKEFSQSAMSTRAQQAARMMAQLADNQPMSQLTRKARSYNHCIREFKDQLTIILSLLDIDQPAVLTLLEEIGSLRDIPELAYHNRGPALKGKADTGEEYTYINMDTTNYFKVPDFPLKSIEVLGRQAKDNSELRANYLSTMVHVTDMYLLASGETPPIQALPLFNHPDLGNLEFTMKSKLKSEEIEQFLDLMTPVFEVAVNARDRAVVYVMGITGEGKSTFLNAATASRYRRVKKDGDWIAEWDPASSKEQCKVGSADTAESETFIPQLVDVDFDGESITYCDLPGVEGSRERALRVCESFAPMLINQEIAAVQGIVWVLSDDSIRAAKSKMVKEFLTALIKIAKGKPETALNSLTLLVTKGSDDLTKEDVIAKLRKAVAALHNPAERDLLNQIITKMAEHDNHSIVISRLFDAESTYIQAVHRSVLARPSQDKSLFDFSLYSNLQEDFVRRVRKALAHYEHICTEQKEITATLEQAQKLKAIKARMAVQCKTQSQNHQRALDELNTTLEDVKHQENECLAEIRAIEDSSNFVVVHHFKENIPGQTHSVKEPKIVGQRTEVIPGAFKEVTRTTWGVTGYHQKLTFNPDYIPYYHYRKRFWFEKAEGSQSEIRNRKPFLLVDDLSQPIMGSIIVKDKVPATRQVDIIKQVDVERPYPKGHPQEYLLIFPADYPVTIQVNDSSGWSVKAGSEQRLLGYSATLIYERGEGCVIDVEIKASPQYVEENSTKLVRLRERINQLGRIRVDLERRQQELEKLLAESITTSSVLTDQLNTLDGQIDQLEAENQALKLYLDKNLRYFQYLQQVASLLPEESLGNTVSLEQRSLVTHSIFSPAGVTDHSAKNSAAKGLNMGNS